MLAALIGLTALLVLQPHVSSVVRQVGVTCSELGTVLGGCPQVRGQVGDGAAVIDGNLTTGGGSGSGGSGPGSPGSAGSAGSAGPGGSGGGDRGAAGWGSSGSAGAGSSGVGAGTGAGVGPRAGADAAGPQCVTRWGRWCAAWTGLTPPQPAQPETVEAVPGAPVVTIRDLAVFRPQPATQFMQPDGWMVVGLPTNFYAAIDRHVVSGTLLGLAADVRFTPIGYEWHYGDGASAWLPDKGASWQASGLSEFDATATSHVFRASGTYLIELDVEYTAEYRFAGGAWTSLRGVIVLAANDLVATAGDAVTVLVDRDCTRTPRGPGC